MISLVDKMIKKMEESSAGKDKFKTEFVERLQGVLQLQVRARKQLEAESRRLPYPQLIEQAQLLIEEEKKHQEAVTELIGHLGGTVDVEAAEAFQPNSDGQFSEILKIEGELEDKFIKHANWAEEKGFRHEAHILRDLKDAQYNCVEKIERLLMRTNGAM